MRETTASHRRAVITGFGLVSPVGVSSEALWNALENRRSGVRPLESLPAAALTCQFGAEAHDFTGHIDDFGPLGKATMKAIRKGVKIMCRETQMAVAAAQRALDHAGLADGDFDHERTGVVFGCDYMLTQPDDFTSGIVKCGGGEGRFRFDAWGDVGLGEMSPLWLLKYLPNMPASHIAIYNDLRGPSNSLTIREASGDLAIGEAAQTIRRGRADRIVSGATGTRIHPYKTLHAIGQVEVASARHPPEEASRPFDADRTGMVLGEGAGVVILEELAVAQARGATIYGEVCSRGSGFAAERCGAGRADAALENAMRAVFACAGITADAIGHIHAYGDSTTTGDAAEARAIGRVFGDRVMKVPVVAAKSAFGNLGAGSGVVELIASLLAFRAGRLFPTQNYRTPDPACPLWVVTDSHAVPGDSVLNLSVTPQGQAAALLVRAWNA